MVEMKMFRIASTLLILAVFGQAMGRAEPIATEPQPTKILTHGNTMGRLSGEVLDLVKFYLNASKRTDIDAALSTLVNELAKKGYVLESVPSDDSIRVGVQQRNLGKYSKAHHFATSDGSIWLDIVNYSGADPIRVIGGNQRYWGYWGGGKWIFYTLNPKDNAVTATFQTDTQVVNIGVSIPIEVPDSSKLSQSDFQCINARIDTLYDVTRLVVQHLVSHENLVMMPSLPGEELTATQRVGAFVHFWSEVKYNFAFFDQVPDLDWDKILYQYLPEVMRKQTTVEYYRLLQKICALLKDGHTNITPPSCVGKSFDRPKIELRNVKRHAIVTNVGKSLENVLALGSEVIAVDGVATKIYLQNKIFPYISSSTDHILWDWGIRDLLKGSGGTEVTITFRTLEGKSDKFKVARNSKTQDEKWIRAKKRQWQRSEFKWLENEIACVALNTFADKTIVEDFEKYLPDLQECRGLVIDIRKNPGGSSGNGYEIIKHLTDRPLLGSKWKTREHRAAFKAWGKFYSELAPHELNNLSDEESELSEKAVLYYKGMVWHEGDPDTIQPQQGDKITVPIVVLIGHVTGSAAEDFLIALDSIERATFVGQKTNGSTGQPLTFNLPGGGSARVCTKRDTYPDGREFVGYGISPHVYVEPTVEDILKDRDIVLEKAIEILRRKILIDSKDLSLF